MGPMFWVWVAVCLICIAVEFISPALTSIWFLAGGLIALLLSCFQPIDWYWQVLAFVVVSVVCLLFIRPAAKKLLNKTQHESSAETLLGKEVRMASDATFDSLGTAVLNGVTWSVRSRSGENIPAGTIVHIVALDGNKLVVEATE